MFRLTVTVVWLLAAGLLAACGSPAATTGGPEDELTIGASFPVLDEYLQGIADGMAAEAAAQGVELVIASADDQSDVQLSQIENFVAKGVSAVLVIPLSSDDVAPINEQVLGAGIPLVYVNRRPADLPEGVPYVGSDVLLSGVVQMTELARLAGGQGNVGILSGDLAQETAQLRTQGCKDVIAENPGMSVIREASGMWVRDEAQSITENWLQSGEQIDVICANNDEMALGAINALKAADALDTVLVGGVDATSDALEAMAQGELEVTVFQDAADQGGSAVKAAVQLIQGEELDTYIIDVPYVLVTPDNVAQFQGG